MKEAFLFSIINFLIKKINLQKFLMLVVLGFLISSCSTRSVQPTNETESDAKEVSAVQVDKENNAFKISPRVDGKKPTVKTKKPLFDWPVWEARMTRGYLPKGTKRRRRPHKGIDLAAPRGTPVMSAHDGVVIYTGSGFKGYGKMIMVESPPDTPGSGFATLYGHLDKIVVYEGQKVKQGEVIGALGNTGRSSGPHLHFEIRKLNGPVDPLPYLPAGDALTNEVDNGAPEE